MIGLSLLFWQTRSYFNVIIRQQLYLHFYIYILAELICVAQEIWLSSTVEVVALLLCKSCKVVRQ